MTVNLPSDFDTPKDSQVIIAIQGTPVSIRERLLNLIAEIDQYGKPIQGTTLNSDSATDVSTPIWNGKKY